MERTLKLMTPTSAPDGNPQQPDAQGRLILMLEHSLSHDSRKSLQTLLKRLMTTPEVTMVSGLSRASMLQAEALGNGLFYNRREYLAPEIAFRMLPWREVWVIAGASVWCLSPS